MVMGDDMGEVADMFQIFRGERARVQLALLTVQLCYGVYYVLTKAAMSGGVNPLVFAVYRDSIALCLICPLAYFSEKKLRTPLTIPTSFLIFFLGFMGIFLQQSLFLVGLALTNTSFAGAMQNAIPVFTFIIAVIFKLEVIRIGKPDGVAKVVGICAAVSGALTMCLYKGSTLLGKFPVPEATVEISPVAVTDEGWFLSFLHNYGIDPWQLGSLCLVGNCLCMGIYANVQVPTLKRFPAPISLSAYSILVGCVALIITGLGTVSSSSEWIINTPGNIVSVLYAGAIASGLNFTLQTWANQRGGPVLLAAYVPLQTVFSAFLGVMILDDPLYMGTIIGSVLILLGLYLVIWGQSLYSLAKERDFVVLPFSGVTEDVEEPLLKHVRTRESAPSTSYGTVSRP